ncbi:ligase-associated DNA damage response endonuclease PdeM [Roseibacillus persicicus]
MRQQNPFDLLSPFLNSEKIGSPPNHLQTLSVTLDLPPGSIELLPDMSVLLTKSRTLVLADTHFGKSAAFRARGLPVPEGDTAADLARIDLLLREHSVSQLVIAGDLLHARVGCTAEVLDLLLPWLEKSETTISLVEGNHDAKCGKNPLGKNWPLLNELTVDGFHILHNPDEELDNTSGFHLGGHLHPAVKIKDGTGTGFRTPVFWLRANQLVLPAFGSFTGGQFYRYQHEKDRLFTPLNNRVVELPSQLW